MIMKKTQHAVDTIQKDHIHGVIFDLDNVLYDETDYIFSAYKEIAGYLSKYHGLEESEIFTTLKDKFYRNGSMYPRLFNDLLNDLDLDYLLPEILHIFSTVHPKIKLYDGVDSLLSRLKKKYKLGLLTNGMVETQKNKIKLLNIEHLFDDVLCARELGSNNEKPNTLPYIVLLDRLSIKPENAMCIGDNPYLDFVGAKKIGILTARVLTGEFKEVIVDEKDDADITINELGELEDIL